MRDDQLCLNCEWWDTRCFGPTGQNLCLRWPEVGLRTRGGQRCWQWAKKAVDPDTEETDPEESELEKAIALSSTLAGSNLSLVRAVELVREAGLSMGHVENGTDRVRESAVPDFPDTGETDPEESDLEKAVDLVRKAGLPTGHAENCTGLVRELLEEIAEQRRTAGKAIEDWAEWAAKLDGDRAPPLLYQACMSGLDSLPEGRYEEVVRQLLREQIEDSTPG